MMPMLTILKIKSFLFIGKTQKKIESQQQDLINKKSSINFRQLVHVLITRWRF